MAVSPVVGKQALVVLQAYVDDSASDTGDRRLYLVVYVQHYTYWRLFIDEWDRILHESPSIDYFKMAEAANLCGQFKGWDAKARDTKVAELAAATKRHQLLSIECSVSRSEFDAIFKPNAPYEFRHPYFLCFYGVIQQLAKFHASMGITMPVDFIFDEQGNVGTEAVMWYEVIKYTQSPEISAVMGNTPIFRNDRDILPLQAADLLVWHLRRSREPRYANEVRPVMPLLHGISHIEVALNGHNLRAMASQFAVIPGISYARDKKNWQARKYELRRRLSLGLGPPKPGEDLFYGKQKRLPIAIRLKQFRRFFKFRRLLRVIRRRFGLRHD